MWWFEQHCEKETRQTQRISKVKRAPRLQRPLRDTAAQAAIELAWAQELVRSAKR